MSSKRRKFTNDEKLNILQLAKQSGITRVLREYHLSYSVFYRWKKQFSVNPSSGSNEDFLHLKQENVLLKRIVADQALELEMKKDQIKNK